MDLDFEEGEDMKLKEWRTKKTPNSKSRQPYVGKPCALSLLGVSVVAVVAALCANKSLDRDGPLLGDAARGFRRRRRAPGTTGAVPQPPG